MESDTEKLLKMTIIGYRVTTFNIIHDDNKPNLILDLDQTIIDVEYNYSENKLNNKSMLYFHDFGNNNKCIIHGRKYIFDFLKNMKDKFNIYIYTNGIEPYAQKFHDYIHEKMELDFFSGIVSRDINNGNYFIKTLEDLSHRNITEKNSIIIDDRVDIWNNIYHNNIINIDVYRYYEYDVDEKLQILNEIIDECYKNINDENIQEVIKTINRKYNSYYYP